MNVKQPGAAAEILHSARTVGASIHHIEPEWPQPRRDQRVPLISLLNGTQLCFDCHC